MVVFNSHICEYIYLATTCFDMSSSIDDSMMPKCDKVSASHHSNDGHYWCQSCVYSLDNCVTRGVAIVTAGHRIYGVCKNDYQIQIQKLFILTRSSFDNHRLSLSTVNRQLVLSSWSTAALKLKKYFFSVGYCLRGQML